MRYRHARLAVSVLLVVVCCIAFPIGAEPEAPAPIDSSIGIVTDWVEKLLTWFFPDSGSSSPEIGGGENTSSPGPDVTGEIEPHG